MWGSFYLGNILKCDCILKYFLGDITTRENSQNPAAPAEISLPELHPENNKISIGLLDKSIISDKITIGIFIFLKNADQNDGTITGEGRVYGLKSISQNKLYFEVLILEPGEIRIGVACKESKENIIDPIGSDKKSWGASFGPNAINIDKNDVIVFLNRNLLKNKGSSI